MSDIDRQEHLIAEIRALIERVEKIEAKKGLTMFTSWKTTAAGVAAMAVPLINQFIPLMPPQWAAVATGVVAGLGLLFAKDSDVTGGTKQQ